MTESEDQELHDGSCLEPGGEDAIRSGVAGDEDALHEDGRI